MLEEMRIRGLGVIDDAVLELSPGLTVVTGETGAGKTMVVQGLSLLFGGRADAGRVRPGAARAVVEGRLVLPSASGAVERALEAGAELDDGALLLSRTVGADGRSRAHVGGRGVPAGLLAELGQGVLALHGQSDQQRLLRPAEQRAALDRYAGKPVTELRTRFADGWLRRRTVLAELHELRTAAAERAREAELLRLGLAEVESAAPQPGEDAALAAEIERLAHADDLRAAAASAQQALTGDESAPDALDALALVAGARKALEPVAGHDPALVELAGRLVEAGHLLADAAGDLASYAAGVDADPARLSSAQERLAVLTALVRRHAADDVDGVLAWAEAASGRLLELDADDDRIAELAAQAETVEAELGELAVRLSAARARAAEAFGAASSAMRSSS
ncbi:MAG TPA: AAA family ATPase, partial [Mycobacteriales bacterium]|nr:AAA family ATPase [Mycobacteriales bacterium]